MRRDRPQASRNHYCRTRRPILSLLIPGCSVAGDQDPSWFLVRGPMPRRCPDVSSPHLHRGGDLRGCALGKTDAGYGWLRVQLEQPSVLLLRCLGPRRAEGSGGRHVRRTGLDMLICLLRELPARISMNRLVYSLTVHSTLSTIVAQPFPSSGRKSDRFCAVDVRVGHGACRCAPVERCSPCSACSGVSRQCCHPRPRVRSRDQSPLHDAVPGPFNGVVLVADERHLDAGFDAVQAMLANLGRSGHLLGGTPETNRINQPNVSSPGGSHDVAFGTGSAWTHWLTSA